MFKNIILVSFIVLSFCANAQTEKKEFLKCSCLLAPMENLKTGATTKLIMRQLEDKTWVGINRVIAKKNIWGEVSKFAWKTFYGTGVHTETESGQKVKMTGTDQDIWLDGAQDYYFEGNIETYVSTNKIPSAFFCTFYPMEKMDIVLDKEYFWGNDEEGWKVFQEWMNLK